MRRAALLALALASGCGYAVASGLRLQGGVTRVAVRPFENLSTDPALGAVVATALREEVARRGGGSADEAAAVIDGEVRTDTLAPTLAGGASQRVALTVQARLLVGGAVKVERRVRREEEYLSGVDALEGEGRRALALRRAADEAARALLDALAE
jgi:hypothetical protein